MITPATVRTVADVRIDQLIQVMEQEPTLVRLDSRIALEPVL
jgi:formylmethanofuran dehydrogenase subunit B